jgi:hypothetical protein
MHFPALQAKKKPAVQHMSAKPMTCARQKNQENMCVSVLGCQYAAVQRNLSGQPAVHLVMCHINSSKLQSHVGTTT